MRQNESEEHKERSAGGPNSEFFAKDIVGTDKADHQKQINVDGGLSGPILSTTMVNML